MNLQPIDWNLLQFSCIQERNPPIDADSEVLCKETRESERLNSEKNDQIMARLCQKAVGQGHYKAMLNLAGFTAAEQPPQGMKAKQWISLNRR